MRKLAVLAVLAVLVLAAPAGAAVSTGSSGWLWGSPEPQGNSLHAIELQGTTGYAVGEFGTLLRTNDGGAGWGTVRTGQTIDYRELDVIDADSIVIASNCAARRTDDAGKTFRRLPFTTSERRCARELRAVSFPSTEVGYLLLEDGGILRTSDGGRSFAPRTLPGGGGFVRAIAFRSANEGLAATSNGDIFRTENGADSWTRVYDGATELDGALFTNSQAVAVGIGGTFLVSADGGQTWTQPSSEPGAPDPPSQDFVDVRCASAAVCLVTTRSSTIYRTADGGRSFASTGTSNGLAVDFASATRAVAVGFAGEMHISNDGGASFSQLGTRMEDVRRLLRVRATSSAVVHAVGETGALARTTDGGETWANVGVPTGADVFDVWFPNASVGYALDFNGGLFRTENGGGSWSILDTGVRFTPNGVFAPDTSRVFLIGPRGVRRSTNGGADFERHTQRVVRNRTLVEADKAGGDVVFYGPRVIALSTNGGNTWKHIDRPTRAEIRHVDFVSSRAGYVLEQSGRVYFTRNRGKSWKQLLGVGYSDGVQLAFGERRSGWLSVTSGHPTVLHTTDGGKSWTPQILAPSAVSSIAAVGSRTGFATISGLLAGILFTKTGGDAGADSTLRLATDDLTVSRGQKIKIRGRLSPAEGGEDVEVRVRGLNGRRWVEIDVTPNRAGRFSFKRRIRRSTVFVAQWEGDANSRGDGSRPMVVSVGG